MTRYAYSILLVFNVLVVYSNHFHNDFQFDDFNAIPNNPAIRQPATILRAFVDPSLFSSAPKQRNYRPVTTASLALDYWIGHGLNVFFFHLSTFLWYIVQLVLMFLLFEHLMDLADPHPTNVWMAAAAAALFGLHPANAETVNYIIQRGDLYNALGCIASLWIFIRYPGQRRFGWYLFPAALAMLSKAPALVFPLLLLAYVLLFENEGVPASRKWKLALAATLPASALATAAAILLKAMQPPAWTGGAPSAVLYRLTQPFVALHYFKTFFLPIDLSVDLGWPYVAPLSLRALAGYAFVAGLLAVAVAAGRRRACRPIAFGVWWFLATLLPTSLMPLGDVANDHRMFFCFVGLTLAVLWSLRLAVFAYTARLTAHPALVQGAVAVLAVVLFAAGLATRVRNHIWLTKESLWSDSIAKNPRNVRALNNFGEYAYEAGDEQSALAYWERALTIDPTFHPSAPDNFIRVAMKIRGNDFTENYLRRMVAVYPLSAGASAEYAEWLASLNRFDEAVIQLDRAQQLDSHSDALKRDRISFFQTRNAAGRSCVFRALDVDHDTRLSLGEMIAAPAVLLTLDKNGDGKLTAEECGADFGEESRISRAALDEARRQFMRSNPLLSALDANHDGEISPSEIQNAEHALARLDRDGDGILETSEIVPDYVNTAILGLMKRLDQNHDRKVAVSVVDDDRLRGLLTAADIDADGFVTEEELTNEVLYRAGCKKDGLVTRAAVNGVVNSFFPVRASRNLSGHPLP